MVYGICRTMLRDVHEAEDATQQAFLSAHKALLGGAQVRDEGAWLATIARNECRGRIAAAMRAPLPLADEDLAAIPASADETERRFQANELRNALAELPDRQREAVILRDVYGLRYGEIAKALGLSRPATEALLFRARRAMRVRLRPAFGTALVVPLAVYEGLAGAIPGFAATGGSSATAAGASGLAGGFLAKLTATPAAAKVATVAVAAGSVGTVGTIDSERAARDRADRPALVATLDSSGPGPGGRHDRRDDSSGPGPGAHRDREDNSGPGSGGGDRHRDEIDSSGPSESSGPSTSSGPGSNEGSGGDVAVDDSSGSSNSGSGSGSSGGGDDSGTGSGDSGSGSNNGSNDP
jgi:RNA polymerase sigma factor (sigma-70 family)